MPELSKALARACAPLCVMLASVAPAGAQVFGALLESETPFDLRDPARPTVLERQPGDLAPVGIGSPQFVVFPQAAATIAYTDNLFGSSTDAESDAVLRIAPSLEARSRWRRHSLQLRASGDLQRHLTYLVRDRSGYDTSAEGRLDLAGGSSLHGQARATRSFVEQYSGAFPQAAVSPVPLDRQSVSLRANHHAGSVRLLAHAEVSRLDFADVTTRAGELLDQDHRDELIARVSVGGAYEAGPARGVFLQGSYAVHRPQHGSTGTPGRGGDDIRLLAGAGFYATPLIRARAAVGYLARRYDEAAISDLRGVAVDVQLDYLLTRLTTISLAATRTAEDAIVASSPGYWSTRAEARIDRELRRNVLVHARMGFEQDAFVDVSRRDALLRLGAGAIYTPRRGIVFEPTVQWIRRDSEGEPAGLRFDETRLAVKTTFRL